METGRLPAFSCSDDAFVAQPDDISARKRRAWGKMARVTQTDNQLVCSNQDCGNIMTERETQKLTIEKKERRDPQGTPLGFRNVVLQKTTKRDLGCYHILSCQCSFGQAAGLAQQQKQRIWHLNWPLAHSTVGCDESAAEKVWQLLSVNSVFLNGYHVRHFTDQLTKQQKQPEDACCGICDTLQQSNELN